MYLFWHEPDDDTGPLAAKLAKREAMAQQHTQQAKATGSNSSNMASLSVPTSSMEDVVMDASFAPAAAVMDRQLTAQQPSNAMAGPVAAAAGEHVLLQLFLGGKHMLQHCWGLWAVGFVRRMPVVNQALTYHV